MWFFATVGSQEKEIHLFYSIRTVNKVQLNPLIYTYFKQANLKRKKKIEKTLRGIQITSSIRNGDLVSGEKTQ